MFENSYPDILGMITGGVRYEQGNLQYAAGAYPGGAAIGQPFEVVTILQSTIDKPQEVVVSVNLPRKDASGSKLQFTLERKQFKLKMAAGEVGILHVPVVPRAPTPVADGYPLALQFKSSGGRRAKVMRQNELGRPPSALSVSPFRLEVLREVSFNAKQDGKDLRCRFDVMPGHLKMGAINTKPNYEVLWTASDFDDDLAQVEEHVNAAEGIAAGFVRSVIMDYVEEATQERFSKAGLVLHPAEVLFITKSITYIYDEAYHYERGYYLRDAKWFQILCGLVAQNPELTIDDVPWLAAGDLYESAVYDAVWINLPMVQQAVKKRYGSREYHREYAAKIVQALQGSIPMDLSYAYLPLVMGGVQLNMRVTHRDENPWDSLEHLEEALRARVRLSTGATNEILKAVEMLIEHARERLRRSRVPRE